ncbi:DDT domain-containing protein DDR4 [Ananas comosus]|uniref:DDT domain-containing protein DDR4 n=2 Tax=Ananas comosus TaxID=4615 RepID=A0A6P5FJK2_ANACO|nr:DDT domain-containing protein DDR4 [Ananas comosus]
MSGDSAPAPPAAAGSSPEIRPPQPEPAALAPRKARFPRACTSRPAAPKAPAPPPERRKSARREKEEQKQASSRVITPLVPEPAPADLPRWDLRSMWELASVLNFLHVFRPLLNVAVEFSAEELETALITPNSTLDDVHMPLLKAIPPVTRMALGRATWVTVLCRKLKDWWYWVAEGEIPIVASHGAEIETYKTLDPATRLLILKAICDIRVEQEDIRNYIEDSLKHGTHLSAFRKERIGGDAYGVSYWYEDDPIIGHRLYREIRSVEAKKLKAKGVSSRPLVSYRWETVATNFDEFQEVSDKLFSSKNRTEVSLGKKLKIDFLPDIEKIHKRKERLLKKQQREALLLDSYLTADGLSSGRSLRDRKPVTYTFDDYDRSINEAIKITKKRQNSPENVVRRVVPKPEGSTNGKPNGPSLVAHESFDAPSPKSNDYEESDGEQDEHLDRSNRRRKRPQRYSEDFVEAVSDIDAGFDSDDDIVGEAVYDEEYLRSRKQQKVSSASEDDEEYNGEGENAEDDEEEEEEEYSLSTSEDLEDNRRYKKLPTRSRRATKLRSVDELQTGLRRSKRATRLRVNYRQYELSDTEQSDSGKKGKSNESDGHSDATDDMELSTASQDQEDDEGSEEVRTDVKVIQSFPDDVDEQHQQFQHQEEKEKTDAPAEERNSVERRFLDLNELAPGSAFDDGPSTDIKTDDMGNV